MHRVGITSHGLVASTSSGPQLRPGSRRLSEQCGTLALTDRTATSHIVPRSRQQPAQIRAALLDPPPFDPAKLTVRYLPGASESDGASRLPWPRRYTLTHNDITGSLQLSIGADYNQAQLSGWYTRILRDEVLAEWHLPAGFLSSSYGDGSAAATATTSTSSNTNETSPPSSSSSNSSSSSSPVLNVYCHVSGEEMWPAPPALRSFIFQREMRLVLDTIAYAERQLLGAYPSLSDAMVYVHLVSDMETLNRVIPWGSLGDRATWQNYRKTEQEKNENFLQVLSSSLFGTGATSSSSTSFSEEDSLQEVDVVDGAAAQPQDIDAGRSSSNDSQEAMEFTAAAAASPLSTSSLLRSSSGTSAATSSSNGGGVNGASVSGSGSGSKAGASLRPPVLRSSSGRPGSVAVAAQRLGSDCSAPAVNGSRPLVEATARTEKQS